MLDMHDLWPDIVATPITGSEDSISWGPDANGFTLRSACRALQPPSQSIPWTAFTWNKSILPRYAFYLWRALLNCVPTHDLLRWRGFVLVSRCALCKEEVETIDHLLWSCPFSQQLWNRASCQFRFLLPSGGTLHGVVTQLLHSSPAKEKGNHAHLFAALVSRLWLERNKRFLEASYAFKIPEAIYREATYYCA